MRTLTGVIPALVTPFDEHGSVNYAALQQLVEFHLHNGVGGMYLTGSTGEWTKLSLEERKKIAEVVITAVAHAIPVVAHIGHNYTEQAVKLCEHAASIGVDMVSAVIPGDCSYTIREIASYYRRIARVGLPVIVYYLGGNSPFFTPRVFVEEIGSIEGVVGLKYTSADLFPMQIIQQLSRGALKVWCGCDQMALGGLIMNAIGVIGSSYNYIPEIFVELYNAYVARDLELAQSLQLEANCISYAVKQIGGLTAYKEVLRMRGIDVGGCRSPSLRMVAKELEELKKIVEQYPNRLQKVGFIKDRLSLVH
jgi:N-acetylneuraminate lyase